MINCKRIHVNNHNWVANYLLGFKSQKLSQWEHVSQWTLLYLFIYIFYHYPARATNTNQTISIFIFFLLHGGDSVLLETKQLVDSIRHFIRDPSGIFSVCHLCECRIVQWRHDSHLLLLLNWFLHLIKRTLHVGSKIWILSCRGKNNISLVRDTVLATRT